MTDPKPKTRIRIIRAFMIIDEIPFNNVYYSGLTDPQQAVERELNRPMYQKLEEFSALLDSTPEHKIKMKEVITVVENENL
jgi:hypothetical protein